MVVTNLKLESEIENTTGFVDVLICTEACVYLAGIDILIDYHIVIVLYC